MKPETNPFTKLDHKITPVIWLITSCDHPRYILILLKTRPNRIMAFLSAVVFLEVDCGIPEASVIWFYIYILWRAEESHDRLLWKQVPGGCIYWTINEVMVPTCLWWFFRASWSCSPAGRVQWVRCPVLVWRADRSTAFWKKIGTNISRLPSGVVAPQTLCCWGFCSPLLSSLSWDRSVRGDCVQVNFLRCQGDADRCPGHVSQYIYLWVYFWVIGGLATKTLMNCEISVDCWRLGSVEVA